MADISDSPVQANATVTPAAPMPVAATLNDENKLEIEMPKKKSVLINAGERAIMFGAVSIGLGSIFNIGRQAAREIGEAKKSAKASGQTAEEVRNLVKALKESDFINKFSKSSHNTWVNTAMIAGLSAGAVLGGLEADAHNKKIDGYRARLEAEEAAKAVAALQATTTGPTK